ncbi:hypothetical protein [Sphingomonas bacterium]|uniref:hypothetical protein n=1 Tax=Sphingomonas bacterium TaxID=1895847 RepID=UPI00157573D1|nr:hypothetical protein [Sphingomonas bacterium]
MRRALCLAAAVIGLSGEAIAGQTQPQSPSRGADIVVTGQRPSTKAEIRHLTSQVMAIRDATEAVARFDGPVCPTAIGMAQEFDDRLARRIADDAREVGIAVGNDGCRPNITIVFIDNGQALVREIRRSHADLFGDMEPHAIKRLADDPGPIHGWTITETTSRDGDKLRVGTTTGVRAPELQVRNASIIALTTKRNILATILIVDIPAAIGKGLDQIADYATMRTLAETRSPMSDKAAGDTILRLFQQGDRLPPPGLTAFDRNYLHALYLGQGTEAPFAKANEIADRINKALSGSIPRPR